MSSSRLLLFIAAAVLAATPAWADGLTFTLDSTTGTGIPPAQQLEGDPPCLPPGCVLFTGTLTDTDTDGSLLFMTNLVLNNASSWLTEDFSFFSLVPGLFFGDGDPVDSFYSGPIFGVDIAPGTPVGLYTFDVEIDGSGGTANLEEGSTLIIIPNVTVEVAAPDAAAPEPAAASLALLGLAGIACAKVKKKWRSSAASH